jgi:ABC-type lipoprotein release transport system permease subunit
VSKPRHNMSTSISERILVGSVSALIGAILGLALALVVAVVWDQFRGIIVGVSAAYFFCVGFLKGSDAGDFAGEALGATAATVAAMGEAAIEPTSKVPTGAGSSVVLWVGYFVCVGLGALLW